MNEERCVSCGEIIPEGRQVCYTCEHEAEEQIDEMTRDIGDVWLVSLDGDVKCLDEVLWDNDILNIAIELHNIGYRKVVMCCECKYCEIVVDSIIDEPKWFCTRMVGAVPIDPTDYCSRAKMKGA